MTIFPGHHEKEQQMTTTANCPMRVGQGQWDLEVHLRLKPPGIFFLFFFSILLTIGYTMFMES